MRVIKPTQQKKNVCVYCNSVAYGPGCPFSPHKMHVHSGDPKRCVYCGSMAMGPGCPFNPFSKHHVHGIEFNSMVNDSLQNSIIVGYLSKRLTEPITEMQAYKLGLIDDQGKRIKKAITLEEKNAYTSSDAYVLQIRKALGSKIDIINLTSSGIDTSKFVAEEFTKLYETELELKKRISVLMKDIKHVLLEGAEKGLPSQILEKLILESFDA